jgi:hypothetical protein
MHSQGRVAGKLTPVNYEPLKNYYRIIVVGVLLLALKIRVGESVPTNYCMYL